MKRVLVILALPCLFACGDTPTQPAPDVAPQFATVIGSGATWHFSAIVIDALDPDLLDKEVTGSITFEIASDDIMPEDECIAWYRGSRPA